MKQSLLLPWICAGICWVCPRNLPAAAPPSPSSLVLSLRLPGLAALKSQTNGQVLSRILELPETHALGALVVERIGSGAQRWFDGAGNAARPDSGQLLRPL